MLILDLRDLSSVLEGEEREERREEWNIWKCEISVYCCILISVFLFEDSGENNFYWLNKPVRKRFFQ